MRSKYSQAGPKLHPSLMPRVVVIMTTFNRKETTLKSLSSLFNANSPKVLELNVVLVDASSSDGTIEEVNSKYPDVETFSATSDTYWAQGMRLAWERAQNYEYDALVWLNDDVVLYKNALSVISSEANQMNQNAIIVGAFEDPCTRVSTYSGFTYGPRFRRLSMRKEMPNGALNRIDAANGNLIWIPKHLDEQLGGFPSNYTHGIADNAFTLEARRKNIFAFLTPIPIGTCSRNSISGTWKDSSLPAVQRLKLLNSPKGLPFGEYWYFCTRYGGSTGFIYALKPFVSLIFEIVYEALFVKNSRIIQ